MKNFLVLLILLLCIQASGQPDSSANSPAFEFPFLPGDSVWATYSSTQDRVNALQIPEETLKNIGTHDLLNICLDFPYNFNMLLLDSEEAGFESIRNQFNGYKELLKRTDLTEALIDECDKIPLQIETLLSKDESAQGKYSLRCYLLFYILGLDEIRSVMNMDMSSRSIESIKKCAEKMNEYPDIFGISYQKAIDIIPNSKRSVPSYNTATRNTPNGYSIPVQILKDGELSSSEKANIKDNIMSEFKNVTFLDEATWKYNCHGYAWYISDGHPSDYIWMNSPTKYWETGCYYEVQESDADVVFYYTTNNVNPDIDTSWHSAIRVNDNEYISKWGHGPLLKHALRDVLYYYGTNLKYYKKYEPKFSYPANSVISSSSTFSIDFVPENYTITWKLADDYYAQNCMSISADGKTCTIIRDPNRDMDRTMLSVQISYNGYNAKTFCRDVYAHSGFKGQYETGGNWMDLTHTPYLIYVPLGNSVTIKSGNLVDATVTYEGDITPTYWSYYDNLGQISFGTPQQTQGSAIVIHATCKDGNKYDLIVLKKSTYSLSTQMDGRQLKIMLNNNDIEKVPTALTEKFGITNINGGEWNITIYDVVTNENKFSGKVLNSTIVDTSSWNQGIYAIRATRGDNVLTEKIIIK